jgi:hypothetical protein
MKTTIVISVAVLLLGLFGCSSQPSLEELESQALITGDWSKVEKREAGINRRQSRSVISCPEESTRVCLPSVGSENCDCYRGDTHTL